MKKFTALLLMLTVLLSSVLWVSAQGEELSAEDVQWSQENPFIMYEDEKGIRYIGPTGNKTEEKEEAENPVAEGAENTAKPSRSKGELAAVGSNVLPSSVDLSTSKYFPAIGNQGSLGSCASWATVYYQFTYEINRMRGTAATAENTASPKFVYNILSQEIDSGTSAEENYAVLKEQGAPSILTLPYDEKHLSWSADEKIWREALNWRLEEYQELEYIGRDNRQITSTSDSDLNEIKTALNDGHIVTFGTYANSWVYGTLKAHPDAPENSKYEGEKIVKYLDGTKGDHRLVIVGYNDNLWFDHNSNNKVDEGEKGALKIANSWGTSYGNKGFCWVSYDALNNETSVEGGYSESDRAGCMHSFFIMKAKPYKEGSGIYLKFTLNTADRTQFFVNVTAEHNGTTEKSSFLKGIHYSQADNRFSFWGKSGIAEDGTFCYPLDNVSPELTAENFNEYNFSVRISDGKKDSKPLTVKNLELVNEHEGKTYKPSVSLSTLDGSEQTVDIKACNTDNKVIYYIGYDEPTLRYRENGTWKEAEMEKNEEHLGHNYKYVIEDIPEDTYIYFTDKNGNTDNNSGSYYIATDRLNYFRTKDVREELEFVDFTVDPEIIDVGVNRYMIPEATGGYEPYYYQFTFTHIASGRAEIEKFRAVDKVMYYFEKEGQYKITAEVMDQTGDIARLEKIVTVTDMPFVFEELTASNAYGGNLLAGDEVTFFAQTNYEKINYMRTFYDVVIKDSKGNTCCEESITPDSCSTNFGYSKIYHYWTPEKKGEYTFKISDTDYKGQYAEKTITFTVLDKICGDSNGDGEVNIKDATAIQKYLAGGIFNEAFRDDLAECDENEILSIKDATCIRKFLANISQSGRAGQPVNFTPDDTQPDTQPQTQPVVTEPKPVTENTVTFTNSHKWSGTLYCYYWSDTNKSMTTWPGKAMTNAGTNTYGESLYTFNVPQGATYIIFTNGSAQTVDIPYSGSEVKYYPLSETDSQGHYKVANW
ncbi:MAG: starch-binding protein [Clostridia bacterium]|nr:starch-binding protein [Clostridia bacterium]